MESSGIRSDDFAGLLAALGRGVSSSTAAGSSAAASVPLASTGNVTSMMPSSMASTPSLPIPQQMTQQKVQQAPIPIIWQPLPAGSFPNMYPQPQFIAPSMQSLSQPPPNSSTVQTTSVSTEVKRSLNPWIVGLLIAAVVVCAAIAWMRVMTVKPVEQEDEEEEEEEDANEEFKAKARKEAREIPVPSSAYKSHAVEEYVAENVLKYVNSDYDHYDGTKAADAIDITGMDIPLQYTPPSPEVIRNGIMKKRIVADESQEVLDYAKKREALFSDKSS